MYTPLKGNGQLFNILHKVEGFKDTGGFWINNTIMNNQINTMISNNIVITS